MEVQLGYAARGGCYAGLYPLVGGYEDPRETPADLEQALAAI